MTAFFSFHLLFMALKRIIKIFVERNKCFHSLWVIGIIINVMVPTQPLQAVLTMHIIMHLCLRVIDMIDYNSSFEHFLTQSKTSKIASGLL